MNKTELIILLIVCALVVEMYRVLPFIIFSGKRKMPAVLERLSNLLPSAIMAVLVVYGLKNLVQADQIEWISTIAACTLVIGLHLWKRNTILSVFAGTALYILLINLL